MTESEKIEKLREKAHISSEEAKAALDKTGGDLLDALLLLERQGKAARESSTHTTKGAEPEPTREEEHNASYMWELIKKLVGICNRHSFIITHRGKQVLSLPITAMVLLLIFANIWLVIALAVGLFCGLRYSIEDGLPYAVHVNDMMDKAAHAAENVRETVEDSLRSKQ